MGAIMAWCILFQLLDVGSPLGLLSRIEMTFQNENISSTFLDITVICQKNVTEVCRARFQLCHHGYNWDVMHLLSSHWSHASAELDEQNSRQFDDKNISSTIVDIVNNMPEEFNLDVPVRITDITSWYNYDVMQLFFRNLTVDFSGTWWAEFRSLFRMKTSHQLS